MTPTSESSCGDSGRFVPPMLSRRTFIAATTAVAGAALSKAFALPFFSFDDDFPIPADKKFSPEWLASLTARGEPTVYRFKKDSIDELQYIGMPVGGICTGQLYLGGDGRLWHFDIFNLPAAPTWNDTAGPHYAKPPTQASPIEHGFAIRIGDGEPRRLDRSDIDEITFKGQYPIGEVTYKDPALPVEVALEAFSPFIPLNEDDSGLPVTILNYTIRNTHTTAQKVSIAGWLQNPVCLASMSEPAGREIRRNAHLSKPEYQALMCSAGPIPPPKKVVGARPDILFEDFEAPTYAESKGGWTTTGTAFGDGPIELRKRPGYMGDFAAKGERAVNTHVTSNGEDVVQADTHLGTLTSREFTIERRYISLLIGGGNHPGKECVNLLIDGAPVRTLTGVNSNKMRLEHIDVFEFLGKKARIQIVDAVTGGWGQVGVDDIVFCDDKRQPVFILEEQPDYGTMALACLGDGEVLQRVAVDGKVFAFGLPVRSSYDTQFLRLGVGSVIKHAELAPGESKTFTFILAWHFRTPWLDSLSYLKDFKKLRRHYASRFKDAQEVLDYAVANLPRLTEQTRLWRDTWYDSTLPHWFLDRTFATACTAATSTCYRFTTPSGPRFYAWEGTYTCAGTCTHVWNYAQTLARIFPGLERNVRETIDFAQEFDAKTGLIHYRGEAAPSLAIDGQCGTILRAYREHTMCPDDSFLKKVWPNVKKAIEFVIARDENQDGILDGEQYNTLDTSWYGQISWISSMYIAVLHAGAAMSKELGDKAFGDLCAQLAARGSQNMSGKLFNGEYFIHAVDPKHPESNSTGDGCHADQLFGQFYAHQLDLPRVVPLSQAQSALRSLYKYNLALDAGGYRKFSEKTVKGGRWFAMSGEPGLLICTWPKGGSEAATGKSGDAWAASYFNECWTGFEFHVAAHMISEGLLQEGLAVTRVVHDRYHAAKRNPYNEVECSSHYARAMSAYGAYLSACGYAHHGPSGSLSFDPRISPDNFRAAFTCATGWGTFRQTRTAASQTARLTSRSGEIRVASLTLGVPEDANITTFSTRVTGPELGIADAARTDKSITLRFDREVFLTPGQFLDVTMMW